MEKKRCADLNVRKYLLLHYTDEDLNPPVGCVLIHLSVTLPLNRLWRFIGCKKIFIYFINQPFFIHFAVFIFFIL
jgi:hypothetical protein